MKPLVQGLQLLPPLEPEEVSEMTPTAPPEDTETDETQAQPLAMPPSKIQTGMKLTKEQLAKLEETTKTRIEELMQEMGLEHSRTIRPDSFLGMRQRYQDSYDGDYSWRKGLGGIFNNSNFTKGTNKRYVRKTAAKMRDDLLGTSPFFAILPAKAGIVGGDSKSKLAQQIEKYIQREVERSNVREGIRMAQKCALIRNEAVAKITYLIESSPYMADAEVLVDQTGNPVKTVSGQFIYKDDNFFADPNVEGVFRLEKEATFQMTEGQYKFQNVPSLKQYRIHYKNVDCRVVDYRSFLCPLTAESVHKADCVVQLMDLPEDQVQEIYGNIDTFKIYQSRLTANDPISGEEAAKEAHGEDEFTAKSAEAVKVPLAEVYRRFDADGDGESEEIFMVFDMLNNKLIFWDYLHRHMEKRPFEVIPGIESVPNRWYAVGVFATMEDHGLYIDGQFNRVNVADSKSETVRFRVRNSVRQWKDGNPIVYGGNDTLDVENGYDAKNPPLFQVNLAQPSEMGMALMREMEQAGDLLWGSISAQDASASNLNQSKTATGILNLERVGDILIKDAEIDQSVAITAIMGQVVSVLLENLDPIVSVFSEEESSMVSLNREEIRDIEKDIRLLLTRSRSVEQLAVNEKSEAICLRYFQLNPYQQFHLRPLYIFQLKSLEVPDADELLPKVTEQDVAAWQQAQAQKPDQEPKEILNYKDAPPSVKRQMEQASGYVPGTQQEHVDEQNVIRSKGTDPNQPENPPVEAGGASGQS